MSRADFMQKLGVALKQVPIDKRAEILADYDSYFSEGVAAGRAEEEVAESLGDPARLGAGLRFDFEIQSWQGEHGARSAWRAPFALTSLVLLDGVLLLPWALAVLAVLTLLIGGTFAVLYGGFMLVVGPFDDPLGGVSVPLLRALGSFAGAVCAFVVAFLLAYALAGMFARLQRLHRLVLRQPGNKLTKRESP